MATPQPPKWSGYTMPNGGMISPLTNPNVLSPTEMAGIVARHGSWEGYVRDAAAYKKAHNDYSLAVRRQNYETAMEDPSAVKSAYEAGLASALSQAAQSSSYSEADRQALLREAQQREAAAAAARAEEERAAALREAERVEKVRQQEAALAVRDAEFNRFIGLRDQQYAAVDDAYQKNIAAINAAKAAGEITSGQREALSAQAMDSRNAARNEISTNYSAARDAARVNYDQRLATPTNIQQLGAGYKPVAVSADVVPMTEAQKAERKAAADAENKAGLDALEAAFKESRERNAAFDEAVAKYGPEVAMGIYKVNTETATKLAQDLFKSAGVTPSPSDLENWTREFQIFGPEAATEMWNKNVAPRIEEYMQQRAQEQFAKTGIYNAPKFAPTSFAAPTGAATPTPSFTTFPSVGVQPGFQPQRPAPTPLITQAERPTLDQAIQFIESGGMSPQMRSGPMQAIPYGELGAFTPQTEPYFVRPEVASGIDQMTADQLTPTQFFPTTAGTYYGMAAPVPGMQQGGSVAQEAKGLASLGRGGDSMLVHMAPEEVAGLRALALQQGTDLTINPETGLPEAKKLKKLFKVALPIVAAFAAPYLSPLAAKIGMSGAALAGGLAGLGTMIGGGKFSEALKTGLTAGMSASLTSNMMGSNPLGTGGQQSTFNLANTFGTAAPKVAEGMGGVSTGGLTADELLASGRGELLAPPIEQAALTPAPTIPPKETTKIFGMSPSTALLGGAMIAGLAEGEKEDKLFKQQEAERQAEEERRRRLGLATFERSLGQVPMAAGGGIIALAGGGMPTFEYGGTTASTGEPRMVQGAGDGMSDNVPATIEGVQEARLANDEFVVPADVVADIGNGSSNAGAKKLYAMMDRIRKARHGTTEQPPEINAEKYMPA